MLLENCVESLGSPKCCRRLVRSSYTFYLNDVIFLASTRKYMPSHSRTHVLSSVVIPSHVLSGLLEIHGNYHFSMGRDFTTRSGGREQA